MLDYLQKFESLPKELRDKISTPAVMAAVEELERKYELDLAALIIKIMVKDIKLNEFPLYFVRKQGFDSIKAEQLWLEIKGKILFSVSDYLNIRAVEALSTTASIPTAENPDLAKQRAVGLGVKGANFFFSPEDEEEIRELTKKIGGYSQDPISEGQIEEKINELVNQAQINFGSENLSDRFKQILKTYLLGIRDRIEVKQTLLKPYNAGGLSFDEDSAEKILILADDYSKNYSLINKITPQPKIKTPEISKEALANLKNVGARDFEYDLSSMTPQKEKLEKAGLNKINPANELAPLTPAVIAATGKTQTSGQIKIKPKMAASVSSEIKPLIRRQAETENKVKIEDVKYIPRFRIMSPIDELKSMDIVNFRRLDIDPSKSAGKLIGKIKLLEEEGYAKRLEGIKAWRLSPLNKLYLAIGQNSISENKPIDVIIEERKIKGEDILSNVEFEAIMDLNKSLRY